MAEFKDEVKAILEGPLDAARARAAMGLIMDGAATPAQLGAFLAALKVRGESFEELVGFARAMRERAVRVSVKRAPLIDTCGTGGDGTGTFNISTTAAFIAAGAGAAVAKHGNRSVSSRCGSADVLEALGVRTDAAPETMARCVEEAGVGFLFAPALHPAMKNAAAVRRELGVRTVFNLLGPMSNPAGAQRQVLGVYSTALVPLMARVLGELGSQEAMVVSSRDGLDELSLSAPTLVAHLKAGTITEYEVDAAQAGLPRYPAAAYAGGDASENARILLSVLQGTKGPARDISVFNAAAALRVAGLATDWKEAVARAAASIDGGAAERALETLRKLSAAR